MKQPDDHRAPFRIQNTICGFDEHGNLITNVIAPEMIVFRDGSFMSTAGGGLPAVLDEGTF